MQVIEDIIVLILVMQTNLDVGLSTILCYNVQVIIAMNVMLLFQTEQM